jgi:hypothetical protein
VSPFIRWKGNSAHLCPAWRQGVIYVPRNKIEIIWGFPTNQNAHLLEGMIRTGPYRCALADF